MIGQQRRIRRKLCRKWGEMLQDGAGQGMLEWANACTDAGKALHIGQELVSALVPSSTSLQDRICLRCIAPALDRDGRTKILPVGLAGTLVRALAKTRVYCLNFLSRIASIVFYCYIIYCRLLPNSPRLTCDRPARILR